MDAEFEQKTNMMQRYVVQSSFIHAAVIAVVFLVPWSRFWRSGPPIVFNEFSLVDGTGGGGKGGEGKAGGGLKQEVRGQVVPQPLTHVVVPQKAAPERQATKGEETWKVNQVKKPVEVKKETPAPDNAVHGEKTQTQQTNVIRLGTSANARAGAENFQFGDGEGGGKGGGQGNGIGIGIGDGSGPGFGGFSSYLRLMRQRLWDEWNQSAVYGSNQDCVVGLTVSRDGSISDIKLEKSSGTPEYDQLALRAVRNANPLPPLPTEFPRGEQRFRIKFRLLE